jgi:hypothetical protein
MTRLFIAAFVLSAAALAAQAPSAHAFHAGKTFDDSPENGGGGGTFYSGAAKDHGWTCAACHVDAPKKMKVNLTTDLFNDFTYEPGKTYDFTLRIEKETKGLASPRANYNGFLLRVLDAKGAPAGSIANAAAQRYFMRSTSSGEIVALGIAGQTPGETEWTFSWVAPAKGRGDITFSLGVVDGNGADVGPSGTRTDPFGDDVYTAEVTVHERGGPKAAPLNKSNAKSASLLLEHDRRFHDVVAQGALAFVVPVDGAHEDGDIPGARSRRRPLEVPARARRGARRMLGRHHRVAVT